MCAEPAEYTGSLLAASRVMHLPILTETPNRTAPQLLPHTFCSQGPYVRVKCQPAPRCFSSPNPPNAVSFGPLRRDLRSSGACAAPRVIAAAHSSLSLGVIDALNYSVPHDKLVKVLEMVPAGKELDDVNLY